MPIPRPPILEILDSATQGVSIFPAFTGSKKISSMRV